MSDYAIVFKVEGNELKKLVSYFKNRLQREKCQTREIENEEELLIVEMSHSDLVEEALRVKLSKKTGDEEFKQFTVQTKAHFQNLDKENFFLPFEKKYLIGTFLNRLTIDPQFREHCREHKRDIGDLVESDSLLLASNKLELIEYCTPIHNPNQLERIWNSTKQAVHRFTSCLYTFILRTSFFVPIEAIREYFGEQVAYYYAWMNFYTICLLVPALIGAAIFALNTMQEVLIDSSPYVPFFSLFMILWSGIFLKLWRRRSIELSWGWQTFELSEQNVIRPGFTGILKKSPITGQDELYYSPNLRFAKYCVSFLVTLCLLMVAFFVLMLSLNLQGYVHKDSFLFYSPSIATLVKPGAIFDPNNSFLHFVPVVLHVLAIQVLSKMYRLVAEKLTEWENHKTEQAHESSLILKRFFFDAFDSYIALFYLAFVERDIIKVRSELTSLYTVDCLRRVVLEVILPIIMQYFSNKTMQNEKQRKKKETGEKPSTERAVRDMQLDEYEEFDDYLEMILAYGYITMFASAFPFASFIQVIYNFIEMKADVFKLCRVVRRPKVVRENSIGSWRLVMQLQAGLSIYTNLGMFYIMSEHLRSFCSNKGSCLWISIFGLEHILLGLLLLIFFAFPDVPPSVDNKIKRKRYLLEEKDK